MNIKRMNIDVLDALLRDLRRRQANGLDESKRIAAIEAELRERRTAHDRDPHDACEKGTVGCSVRHPIGHETDCETW